MKKITFIILITVATLAFLVLPGCEIAKNITGTWMITTSLLGDYFTETYDFVGNRHSGEVLWNGQSLGTYSVSGDHVSFTLEYYDADDDYTVEVYNGTIETEDFMSGTFSYTVEGYASVSGTWMGDR